MWVGRPTTENCQDCELSVSLLHDTHSDAMNTLDFIVEDDNLPIIASVAALVANLAES